MKEDSLSEEVRNWLYFADEDLRAASIMMEEGLFNKVCFFSQQSVEKNLKAFLLSKQALPKKTHKLIEILSFCVGIDTDFAQFEGDCLELDRYYLPTRYPDAIIGTLPEGLPREKEAKAALGIAKRIFKLVSKRLAS